MCGDWGSSAFFALCSQSGTLINPIHLTTCFLRRTITTQFLERGPFPPGAKCPAEATEERQYSGGCSSVPVGLDQMHINWCLDRLQDSWLDDWEKANTWCPRAYTGQARFYRHRDGLFNRAMPPSAGHFNSLRNETFSTFYFEYVFVMKRDRKQCSIIKHTTLFMSFSFLFFEVAPH